MRPRPDEGRILNLDVLRGVAVLGILAVNITAFALPFTAAIAPEQIPFAHAPGTAFAQWVTKVFFEQKFVTLFSLLFGVSIFLVGGERDDYDRAPILERRLRWLAVFALIHGAVFWFGDILLLYAWAGMFVGMTRSWSGRKLVTVGGAITLVLALGQALYYLYTGQQPPQSGVVSETALADSLTAYQSGWPQGLRQNLGAWAISQIASLTIFALPVGALMMLGMGLFKLGFFEARLPKMIYLGLMAIAVLLLALNGSLFWIKLFSDADHDVTGGWATATHAFPLLVTLGYASALILFASALKPLGRLLAPVGRMAFTNYLTQTLIFTTLFSMPWGPLLMGKVDYVQMWGLVIVVWILQLIWSPIWLTYFRMGPFEWVWRCLTHKQRLPLRRV